nr:hypothetical protein CFP56_15306 [Quercus suber]
MLCSNGLPNKPSLEGPMAMIYECEVGWVPEAPRPNPAYWKRIKRDKTNDGSSIKLEPIGIKRPGPNPLQALDPNVPHTKKLKENNQRANKQGANSLESSTNVYGGKVVVAMQPHRAQ